MGNVVRVGAVALTIAVLGAASALGAGLKTASETTLAGLGEDPATPECTQGKSLSGGFAAEDSDASILGSAKDGRSGWSVEATSEDDATQLTGYAYCARKAKNPTTQSASVTVEDGEIGSATASCPPGTKAVSGGFAGDTGLLLAPELLAHESRKLGARQWTARAANYGFIEGTLTAYVNCRKGKGLKTKSKSTTVEGEVGDGSPTASVRAKCKRGTKAIAGGFSGQVDSSFVSTQPGGANVLPYVSRRDGGRRWETTAANFGDDDGSLTGYVYCEKKPKKK